ncbi:hypothetical protein HO484_03370 [Streptococcus suis]|nr:hypothetical protein [Streptococcus suis]HEM4049043.1 hypothetical protein [Streptococcus suis]
MLEIVAQNSQNVEGREKLLLPGPLMALKIFVMRGGTSRFKELFKLFFSFALPVKSLTYDFVILSIMESSVDLVGQANYIPRDELQFWKL